MDKKNRTDLLAAGRKKLQQFRQKKDGKGSKTSGKASKSDHDSNADEVSTGSKSAKAGPNPDMDVDNLSVSLSRENSMPTDVDIGAADQTSVPVLPDISTAETLATTSEHPPEVLGVDDAASDPRVDVDSSPFHEVKDTHTGDPEKSKVASEISEGIASEGTSIDAVTAVPDDLLVPPDLVASGETIGHGPGAERVHGENQEVDGSGLKQVNRSYVLEPEGGRRPSVSGIGGTGPRDPGMDEATSCAEKLHSLDISTSVDASNELQILDDSKHLVSDQAFQNSSSAVYRGLLKMPSVVIDNGNKILGKEGSLICRSFSTGTDLLSINFYKVQEGLQEVGDDGLRVLLRSRAPSTAKLRDSGSSGGLENSDLDFLGRLKEHLYLTNCAKDIFHMELAEQSEVEVELNHHRHQLVDELSTVMASLNVVQVQDECLAEELAQCRSELQGATREMEEAEKEFHTAKMEAMYLSAQINELQTKLERSEEELSSLSIELGDCRGLMAVLQGENEKLCCSLNLLSEERKKLAEEKETLILEKDKLVTQLMESKDLVSALRSANANMSDSCMLVTEEREKLEKQKEHFEQVSEKLRGELTDCKNLVETLKGDITNLNLSLASVAEERDNLGEQKKYYVNENEKQLAELADCKDSLASLQMECSKAVDELKDATTRLEQLTEENIFLKSSLDLNKVKLSELEDWKLRSSSLSEEARNEDEGSNKAFVSKESVCDDSLGFVVLKGHLEEAEKIMQKFEKAVEGMHSHSTSLARSSSRVVAPGVSKLIQAFESQSHGDNLDSEEMSAAYQSITDLYKLTKEQGGNLRAVLKEFGLETDKASEFVKGERNARLLADSTLVGLKDHYEGLNEHCNSLEEENIELVVVCEVMRQQVIDMEGKKDELGLQFEALRQENVTLKGMNIELGKNFTDFEVRINELQRRLDEFDQHSGEMVSTIYGRVEALDKEVVERSAIFDQEWNSLTGFLVQEVEKLNASIETCSSTVSTKISDGLDIGRLVAASVDAATKVVEDLQEKLRAALVDHETICSSYADINEKFNNLTVKNQLSISRLHQIYSDLQKLLNYPSASVGEIETDPQSQKLIDPPDFSDYDVLIEQLGELLGQRLQLESLNIKLHSELMDRTQHIDELNKRCLGSDLIQKLLADVEQVVELKGMEIKTDDLASSLELLISFLVQKYIEVDKQINLSREEFGLKETDLSELHDQVDWLSFLVFRHENEALIFKDSLRRAEENWVTIHSELQQKVAELHLSEQRVSSLREKLNIAVSKGKGLVLQRDSLKQSLENTSAELDKCSHEIQSKDAKLQELELKLKTYSEAGDRVEALESELSYIRNSATALRESFLLKDSVLQKIEEILEDLELPEHFHSRGIIEKVDWLARSVSGSSVPLTDWDQTSHMGEGSYTDAGFMVMDSCNEDAELNSYSGDDLRRKYEELENKFYGLAEQNEMLEQSLMERNNLVQRWEEILDRIDMPLQFKSMEPEERIRWLGAAVSEAQNHCDSLQQKIDRFDTFCRSLTTDLEESQKRVSDLEVALQSVISEKELLSNKLGILTNNYDNVSQMAAQFEVQNDKLQNEVISLQGKLNEKLCAEDHVDHTEGELRRLQDLLICLFEDPVMEDVVPGSDNIEYLEKLLRKLIEKYRTLASDKHDVVDAIDNDVVDNTEETPDKKNFGDSEVAKDLVVELQKKLEDTMDELMHVKESRDLYMEKNQSLLHEVEALDTKRLQLQELLNQEEQKSASLREKLNVAVRKGKSLVQQRDSMKQTIEELNSEVERLKSEIRLHENSLSDYEQKIKDLSAFQEMAKVMESENMSLSNRLVETEHRLQENVRNVNLILNALGDIDVDSELNFNNPVEKLETIGRLWHDLQSTVASSEHESRKSKRAAELLLAELNEVQERHDTLQEEFAKASSDILELSKEKDLADAVKSEALARLDKLSAVYAEERDNLVAELSVLNSTADQLKKDFLVINNLLGDVLSKDLEFLCNLDASIMSCVKPTDTLNVVCLPADGDLRSIQSASSEIVVNTISANSPSESNLHELYGEKLAIELCSSIGNHLQGFTTDIGALREKLYEHSSLFYEEANNMKQIVMTLNDNITFQKEKFESMERDICQLESIEEEKHAESVALHRNLSLLYEACHTSVMEMENWKTQLVGKGLAAKLREPLTPADSEYLFSSHSVLSSEDCVRTLADKLLSVVKDLISLQIEMGETGQKEMKTAISNLQKELQEKDIQKERICMELVSQIKEAEAAAKHYLQELQPANALVHDLERQLHVMEEEHITLEKRVNQLQDQEASSVDLQTRIESLTETLGAKDQEIEGLMQALDEEETQMEDLSNKIAELESVLQQKNIDLENLDASHGKALKKLSITVSKFDELHRLSESLLSEVEKLQLQVQDRDAEISFLRQEVTRCTNDALVASQLSSRRNSDEIHELLIWLENMVSQLQVQDVQLDDIKISQGHESIEIIQKQIMSILSELEDLRITAQNRDKLLQFERSRVEELTRKEDLLENSLLEKDLQLNVLRGVGGSEQAASATTEIVEVGPGHFAGPLIQINKWTAPGTSIIPQVRSWRKANNDQVAIAIDKDQDSAGGLEDEDDDKAHGFKSLTTSRVVPRFTRPVTDMIDGLWVSCDRALMRQPGLRLGVIIYWAVMHALLATFVV